MTQNRFNWGFGYYLFVITKTKFKLAILYYILLQNGHPLIELKLYHLIFSYIGNKYVRRVFSIGQ